MAENENDDSPAPEGFTDDSPDPGSDAELAILCDALQEHGISKVVVRYQGCGDSGGVEAVEFEPAKVQLPDWMEDNLRDVAERYCPDGYEINEGGSGVLTVHPFLGLAELKHTDRFEDSEDMDEPAAVLPPTLRRQLSRRGVRTVTARFNGCGDSGQFEDMTTEPDGVELSDALRDELENFLFEQLPGGWEINEGSFGTFTVDVRVGTVGAEAYWRVERDAESQVTRWQWRP